MTDIVQAREATIASETTIEGVFNDALDRLHVLNTRIMELYDAIKTSQPVASGSVCLELYPCGPGCTGCPHPRWVKYHWTKGTASKLGQLISANLDAQKRDPVLTLSRKDPHYPKTVALVREAKAILSERAELLAAVRTLRNSYKRN